MEGIGFLRGLVHHVLERALGQSIGSHEVEAEDAGHLLVEVLDWGVAEAIADELALFIGDVVGYAAVADRYVEAAEVREGAVH